jgi:hypothetical protein
LEDVSFLDKLIDLYKGDWSKINKEYSIQRRPAADAAKRMTDECLIEYCQILPDPSFKVVGDVIGFLLQFHGDEFKMSPGIMMYTLTDYTAIEKYKVIEQAII